MHDPDETFETDPPRSMDVDESQTADPSEIKLTSEHNEALEGNQASTFDCEQDARLDIDFGDLAVGTGINEDTDDAECNEAATISVKETPVEDSDALASDDKPETFPGDKSGDFSFSGVTQKCAYSGKEGVSDNDTPFKDADSSVSEQESSPDDVVGYLSAVDVISTGFNEESNVEDDEASNDGETDTKNEEEVPKNDPGTIMDDDFGDFSGEDSYIRSKESDIDALHSTEKSTLPGNSKDPNVTHEPSQEDAFSSLSAEPIADDNELLMDAMENDDSTVLPNKGTDGDAILDEASGSEQIDLKQTSSRHAIEDEMQVDATQNTSEALPAILVDEQEEGFGDFGTFNEAAPSGSQSVATPMTSVDPQAYMDSNDDDDFGDFGSFEQAKDPNQPSKVEQVEKLAQSVVSEPPELAGQSDDDDDFGDFGDFTDFAADQSGQDVEGQGATEDTPLGSRSVGDTSIRTEWLSSTTGVVDPVVQRAESVFLHVFGQGVEGGDSVEADRDASARIVFSIHSVLSSLVGSNGGEGLSTWCTDALSSVLRGAEHMGKDGPIAIVNERSENPYAHFMVPIGLPMSEVETQGRNPRRRDLVQEVKFSPFSGPQQAQEPTSNEVTSFPAEPSSSQAELQSISGTVVSLPPLKSDANVSTQNGIEATVFANFETSHAHSNGKKETLSATAKQFLQQIPDLSFMLKPTLSLPKKK